MFRTISALALLVGCSSAHAFGVPSFLPPWPSYAPNDPLWMWFAALLLAHIADSITTYKCLTFVAKPGDLYRAKESNGVIATFIRKLGVKKGLAISKGLWGFGLYYFGRSVWDYAEGFPAGFGWAPLALALGVTSWAAWSNWSIFRQLQYGATPEAQATAKAAKEAALAEHAKGDGE